MKNEMPRGEIAQPDKGYEVSCLFCGSKENLKIYPHRSGAAMHGMIYSCCPIPEDHKFFLMPSETENFVMIPEDIFHALTSDAACRVARHGYKASGFDHEDDAEDAPDSSDFYDAISGLRTAKFQGETKKPLFKRAVIGEECS